MCTAQADVYGNDGEELYELDSPEDQTEDTSRLYECDQQEVYSSAERANISASSHSDLAQLEFRGRVRAASIMPPRPSVPTARTVPKLANRQSIATAEYHVPQPTSNIGGVATSVSTTLRRKLNIKGKMGN